jgi:hypothetical protein
VRAIQFRPVDTLHLLPYSPQRLKLLPQLRNALLEDREQKLLQRPVDVDDQIGPSSNRHTSLCHA